MTYVAPSTVTAGSTYTAAAHNVIVNDIIDHESRISANAYPLRNLLINGAMQFAQRGSSVTGITTGAATYNTADRWALGVSALGTITNAISADAPTTSGFRNSLRTTATVSAATAAASYVYVQQRLEGQTLQHIKKGTASAEALTLSFWAKGSATGTYTAELIDNDNTRSVSATYTISAADTWEYKTITFPADTTGALDNDANYSLAANFWLGAGTNYTSGSLATTWASTTTANRVSSSQVNVAGATNRYLAITGTQLEIGSYATPYAFIPYDVELARCQRYYYLAASGVSSPIAMASAFSATQVTGVLTFPVAMRAAPVNASNSGTDYFTFVRNGATDQFNSITVQNATPYAAKLTNTTEIASTAGHAGWIQIADASAIAAVSAEL